MTSVAIIGSGFGGLAMAIECQRRGHEYTVFERADSVGGTWRANTYPGAECDIPSALYSFSYEPYPWPNKWSEQPAIRAYLEHCVERYGLGPHLRLGTEVVEGRFDAERGRWTLRTAAGDEHEAEILVSATGQLSRPRRPDIDGLDSFGGPVFHSAEWDHDVDLAGRRVGVIGNGASAVQFVPKVAEVAEQVVVFQRTPNWILPKRDRPIRPLEQRLLARWPIVRQLQRFVIWARAELVLFPLMRRRSRVRPLLERVSLAHLERSISDPETRRRLRPDYPMGARRVLISDDYYEAIDAHGVVIETDPIDKVTDSAVVTAGGTEHEVDVLVLGTGFSTSDFLSPIELHGPDGESLGERWRHGAEAYLGMAVHGFPNLFFLYGPNTNLGHNSIVHMLESQTRYVAAAADALDREGLRSLEVRPEVQERYNRELQRRLAGSVWSTDEESWYLTEGKVTNNWPGRTSEYRRRTATFDLDDYRSLPDRG
jgi:cation diffusion facilitator CzcD-associated flavoprotein CzcO